MASYNIEMNVKTDTGYDQLYPQTKIGNVENGASKSISVQINAPSADWQGDNAPYTLTLTANGVTVDNNIEVVLSKSNYQKLESFIRSYKNADKLNSVGLGVSNTLLLAWIKSPIIPFITAFNGVNKLSQI